jgi:hypothetical protein
MKEKATQSWASLGSLFSCSSSLRQHTLESGACFGSLHNECLGSDVESCCGMECGEAAERDSAGVMQAPWLAVFRGAQPQHPRSWLPRSWGCPGRSCDERWPMTRVLLGSFLFLEIVLLFLCDTFRHVERCRPNETLLRICGSPPCLTSAGGVAVAFNGSVSRYPSRAWRSWIPNLVLQSACARSEIEAGCPLSCSR